MFNLKNESIEIGVTSHGAELVKVVKDGKNYLWHADSKFWGRTSPVLFPIVGMVANGQYFIGDDVFELSQHGFARDTEFSVSNQTDDELWMQLTHTDTTKKVYPFEFELLIGYRIDGNQLTVTWRVINHDKTEMPFSIGAHPAFLTDPLSAYHLEFQGVNNLQTLIFNPSNGLIDLDKSLSKVSDQNTLHLNKRLFEQYPTLIFEKVTQIVLKNKHENHQVTVSFPDFPYVGIWSPINQESQIAPFVCIEPWYGLADTSEKSGQLRDKVGIQILPIGETFEASYTMTFDS